MRHDKVSHCATWREGRNTPRPLVFGVALLVAGLADVTLGGTSLPDLTVSKLEVTHSIQYLDNESFPDNSLALIRGRRTIVRMYVGVSEAEASVAGVDGELRVFVNGVEMAGSPFSPENGPITAPLAPDREETDHTLNFKFEVPGSGLLDTGTVNVDLIGEVNPDQTVAESDFGNNTLELSELSFECRRSPSIAYIPVNYFGEAPDAIKMLPGIGDDYIWHTYPIPDPPNYYAAPAIDFDMDLNTGGNDSDLINDLEAARAGMVPMPDFVYGWLPGNPYSGNGLAAGIGTGNAAFGNTQDDPNRFQRTFAHEIGHLLGLSHNSLLLDPEVGFDGGWIPFEVTDTDDCDPGGVQGTKCRELKDFMYAGQLTTSAWIAPDTYDFIAAHELLESSCPGLIFRPFEFREFFLITGKVVRPGCEVIDCCPGCPGPGVLDPIWQFRGPVELTRGVENGTRRLELQSRSGQVLFGLNFEVEFELSDSNMLLPTAPFALVVPAMTDVHSIALLSEGRELTRMVRSPNRPMVRFTSPSRNGQILQGRVPIRWEATDPDGDPLTFYLQYSRDGGKTFVPVAVNLTRTEFMLDTSRIAGGQTALLRLFATDGLNTAMAQVGVGVPDRKLPMVRIVEPAATPTEPVSIRPGAALILVGYGHDAEDGFLPEKALLWRSSRNGFLGAGRVLQTNRLSLGEHTITLKGTDRDGNAVEASIGVHVGNNTTGGSP